MAFIQITNLHIVLISIRDISINNDCNTNTL